MLSKSVSENENEGEYHLRVSDNNDEANG